MCLPTSTAASVLTTRIIKTVKLVVVQVSLLICLLTNLHLLSYVPVSFRRFCFLFTRNIYSKSFLRVTFCGYHVRFFIGLYFEVLEILSLFHYKNGGKFAGNNPTFHRKFLLRFYKLPSVSSSSKMLIKRHSFPRVQRRSSKRRFPTCVCHP